MVVADARDRVSFAQAAEQRLVARRACAAAGDRETAAGEDTGAGGDEKTAAGQAARESGEAGGQQQLLLLDVLGRAKVREWDCSGTCRSC